MPLAAKIAWNTAVQIAGKAVSTLLGLAAIAMITRSLGQTAYGEYTTIIAFLSSFAVIADLGLTLVTVRLISPAGADEKKILSALFGLRLASAVLFLGLAPLGLWFFPYGADIKIGSLIVWPSFLFIALSQILIGLFQKYLRMAQAALAEIIGRLVLIAAVFLAIRAGGGLFGILAATAAASAAHFAGLYLMGRRLAAFGLSFDRNIWREAIRLSWPLALTIALNLIYLRADILLLSLLKRPSQIGLIAEVGLYGAAYRLIDVVITVPFMIAGLVLPVLAAAWAAGHKERFFYALKQAHNGAVFLAVPLVVGTIMLSDDIVRLIAGPDFTAAAPILRILILAAGFIYLGALPAHAIIALDRQKKIIAAYGFTAATALAGYLIFIPLYGYYGAAWVTVYSEAAMAAANILIAKKYSGWRPDWLASFKSLLAASALALVLAAFARSGLILKIAAGTLAYAAVFYLIAGQTRKDWLALWFKKEK